MMDSKQIRGKSENLVPRVGMSFLVMYITVHMCGTRYTVCGILLR